MVDMTVWSSRLYGCLEYLWKLGLPGSKEERERKRERNLELNQIGPLTIEGDLREIRKGQIKYLARLSQIKFKQRRSSGYAPPRNAQKLF